jgi:hypothetical protein
VPLASGFKNVNECADDGNEERYTDANVRLYEQCHTERNKQTDEKKL